MLWKSFLDSVQLFRSDLHVAEDLDFLPLLYEGERRPMEWCNSGGSAPATPGLTARLPQISALAMGGPVCDPVRSTTTKPNTDHGPHP
jgi:hypothetical protein